MLSEIRILILSSIKFHSVVQHQMTISGNEIFIINHVYSTSKMYLVVGRHKSLEYSLNISILKLVKTAGNINLLLGTKV